MKPYRVSAAPAQLVKAHLATALSPVRVALSLPSDFVPKSSPTTVVVFDDGGPGRWPAATKPVLRVTGFGYGVAVRTVVAQALAEIMSAQINGVVFSDPSAILEGRDPNNQADMASFTVSALARTLAG